MTTTLDNTDVDVSPKAAVVVRTPRKKARQRPEAFTVISYVGVSLFAFACLAPFWMIIAGSLTDEVVLSARGYSLWPDPLSFAAYERIFSGTTIWTALGSSVFITVVGTAVALAATSGISWVIARGLPRVSAALSIYAYIPMLFSGGLVPFYILMTQVLNLRDTIASVILPLFVASFLVFVQVSFFRGLPVDILDSARIDGAGELRIFFQIVLPLSKPVLAVVGLFYAVTYWNEWFHALLFITTPELQPLQLVLQKLIANVSSAWSLTDSSIRQPVYQIRLAMTVITVLPILFAYPFAQRYFVSGLTLGATKG